MHAAMIIFCAVIAVERCYLCLLAVDLATNKTKQQSWCLIISTMCVYTEYGNCKCKNTTISLCQGDTDRIAVRTHTNNIIDHSLKCTDQLTMLLNVVSHSHQLTLWEMWRCPVTTLRPFLCSSFPPECGGKRNRLWRCRVPPWARSLNQHKDASPSERTQPAFFETVSVGGSRLRLTHLLSPMFPATHRLVPSQWSFYSPLKGPLGAPDRWPSVQRKRPAG